MPAALKASAISPKTLASTEPEGKAEGSDQPWLFTASMMGFGCFRRMNLDSTPMKRERFSSLLAFLEGGVRLVSRRKRVEGRGRGRYALDDSTKDRTRTEIDLVR